MLSGEVAEEALVWNGEMENRDDKIDVVVKFAKNYCETVHKHLAAVEWPQLFTTLSIYLLGERL